MKKLKITEEMGVHEEWFEQAQQVKLENLQEFINHLLNDYEHDYGTIVHAIAAGAIATAWAMNNHEQGGITGFQASCIMWDFVKHWNYPFNETGLRITDFDEMLYPQYEHKFEKIISRGTWKAVQAKAAKHLNEGYSAHPRVIDHWQSIADGIIPFGYRISDEK